MNSIIGKNMNTNRGKRTSQVSVRFSEYDYNIILKEAEENNMNAAEVLRRSRKGFLDNKEIEERFTNLEMRLVKKIFEIVAAIANIDDQEKIVARKKYYSAMKRGE